MTDKKRKCDHISLIPGGKDDDTPNWDEWHVPGRDDKGHTERLQIRVPPQFIGLAHQILNTKCYPYRDIGYLYRHAFMRHFKWLREHPEYDDGVGSTINALNAMVEICREHEYIEDFRTIFDKLDEIVREHRKDGSKGSLSRAKQMILKVWAQIKQMTDEYWQEQFEGELKRRFGDLLKGKENHQ